MFRLAKRRTMHQLPSYRLLVSEQFLHSQRVGLAARSQSEAEQAQNSLNRVTYNVVETQMHSRRPSARIKIDCLTEILPVGLFSPTTGDVKPRLLTQSRFPYIVYLCSKVIAAPYIGHMHVDLAYIGDLSPRHWVGLGAVSFVLNDSSSNLNYPTKSRLI